MNIAIISIYPFPKGMAPTNRILSYAGGMVQNGASVEVYIPFPTDRISQLREENRGVYNDIKYQYTSGRYKSKSKLVRAFATFSGYRKIVGLLLSSYRIIKDKKVNPIDIIIISADQLLVLYVFSFIAKKVGASSVFIFDEYPIPIRHKLKSKIPLWKEFFFRLVLKRIDAYISISETLRDYFCNIVAKPSYILSSITDVSRFRLPSKISSLEQTPYLCYMGNLELAKDDVDNIVNAFALIASKYPSLILKLYGNPSNKDKGILNSLIKKHRLENRVFFMGKVSFDEVPSILCNAKVLLSSQPNTVRASGGFPTKLGEYLASGVPTLLTNVGENARYVNDGIHVFFVEPNDSVKYANKLDYILSNYSHALKVAESGKNLLFENFSNTKRGKEVLDFLLSLNQCR